MFPVLSNNTKNSALTFAPKEFSASTYPVIEIPSFPSVILNSLVLGNLAVEGAFNFCLTQYFAYTISSVLLNFVVVDSPLIFELLELFTTNCGYTQSLYSPKSSMFKKLYFSI